MLSGWVEPIAQAAAQPWWPPVLAAVIPLVGVVLVAIYTARNGQALERLRTQLAEDQDESSARRAYNFDARNRLYRKLEPAFFQLREQSEAALFRIHGLAKSAREGRLDSTQPERNRLDKASETYLPSTMYRFMAPLATYRLCQRRLTSVDLSLDERLARQYLLGKMLYRSWSDGDEIAKDYGTKIPYDLGGEGPPSSTRRQHLSVQKVECIIEAMTARVDGGKDAESCLTLGEFMERYNSPESPLASALVPVRKLFVDFHPESRPVLWRILIVHAHLYSLLSGHAATYGALDFESVFSPAEQGLLAWQKSGQPTSTDPFAAGREYLAHQVSWFRTRANGDTTVQELEELARLHRSNDLTDDEFVTRAKAIFWP
jgi:hypothetical protein